MKFIITSYCYPERPEEKDFATIEELIDWLREMDDDAALRVTGRDVPSLELHDHIRED